MGVEVVLDAHADGRNVGRGIFIERDRKLRQHVISATERPVERDPDAEAGGALTAALRFAEDGTLVEELTSLTVAPAHLSDQWIRMDTVGQ